MKFGNEITVEIDCSIDELKTILKEFKFKIIDEYDLHDIYMIEKKYINEENKKKLLKHCVLIRSIVKQKESIKMIVYKYKEFNKQGDITKQGKISCKINDINEAKLLFEAINYQELININDHIIVMANETDEFAIQLVNNKHIYIEIEDECNYIKKKYKNIDEMKNIIVKYNIPIKLNNYFVKKAEIELEEVKK